MALRLWWDHLRLLLALAAVTALPELVFNLVTTSGVVDRLEGNKSTVFFLMLSRLAFATLVEPVSGAAVTYAVLETQLGRPVSFFQSLGAGLAVYWRMVGTYALWHGLMIAGGLLILPGAYFLVLSIGLLPVMMVERRFGWTSLRRCRQLVHGQFWRAAILVGLLLALWVPCELASGVMGVIFSLGYVPKELMYRALGLGITTLTTVVNVLFYIETRARREGGLDL